MGAHPRHARRDADGGRIHGIMVSTETGELAVPRAPGLLRRRVRGHGVATAHTAAVRDTGRVLLGSRLVVWLAGAGTTAVLGLGPARKVIDHAQLTRGFGSLGDLLVAPAARWDAGWYLLVAQHGYAPGLGAATAPRSVFFPLYPLLVRGFSGTELGPVGAGVLISVVALALALYWLHRLTALEFGSQEPGVARAGVARAGVAREGVAGGWEESTRKDIPAMTVAVVAFAPMAFFFSAVYSEALFLALSVGVFWCARTGRWAFAAVLGALASATRPTGVLLIAPVVILYLYGPRGDRPPDRDAYSTVAGAKEAPLISRLRGYARPRYRLRWNALWLALMPVGVVAFAAYLGLSGGDPTSPFSSQQLWGRYFAGPFVGLWDGVVAAFGGVRQLVSLQEHHSYVANASGAPLVSASHDVVLFGFAVVAIVAVVGVLRTLPPAYGAYVVLALALPLSYPVAGEPLMSLPRFLLVLFPLGMWMGRWLAGHPRARAPVLLASALSMAFFTGAFATWHWVS